MLDSRYDFFKEIVLISRSIRVKALPIAESHSLALLLSESGQFWAQPSVNTGKAGIQKFFYFARFPLLDAASGKFRGSDDVG